MAKYVNLYCHLDEATNRRVPSETLTAFSVGTAFKVFFNDFLGFTAFRGAFLFRGGRDVERPLFRLTG